MPPVHPGCFMKHSQHFISWDRFQRMDTIPMHGFGLVMKKSLGTPGGKERLLAIWGYDVLKQIWYITYIIWINKQINTDIYIYVILYIIRVFFMYYIDMEIWHSARSPSHVFSDAGTSDWQCPPAPQWPGQNFHVPSFENCHIHVPKTSHNDNEYIYNDI